MITKAIILAGGKGSRLSPLTKSINKQLLPVYDKPLIFYPLSILMLANIREILIIVNTGQIEIFKNLLKDGRHLGLKITYKEQPKPNGLPEAFIIGENFIKKNNVALILGDNFFYGQGLTDLLKINKKNFNGCNIFIKEVQNPENYGVVKIKSSKIIKIVEKPKYNISNKAITGLYYFDKDVVKIAKQLKPSKRGETEIVDLIKSYLKEGKVKYQEFGRGAIWSDAGKIDDLINISEFVLSVEKVQGIKIACLEEIALQKKWINKKQVKKNISFYGPCPYSNYLNKLL